MDTNQKTLEEISQQQRSVKSSSHYNHNTKQSIALNNKGFHVKPGIILKAYFDNPDELEVMWHQQYIKIKESMKQKSEQEINTILNKAATNHKQHAEVILGLMYAILVERFNATNYFKHLTLIVRDNFSLCVQHLRRLIEDKFHLLIIHVKFQVIWLLEMLAKLHVPKLWELFPILIRQITHQSTCTYDTRIKPLTRILHMQDRVINHTRNNDEHNRMKSSSSSSFSTMFSSSNNISNSPPSFIINHHLHRYDHNNNIIRIVQNNLNNNVYDNNQSTSITIYETDTNLIIYLLHVFHNRWKWFISQKRLVSMALYAFMSLISEQTTRTHVSKSIIVQSEVTFCVYILRKHFDYAIPIGRDLLRLFLCIVYQPDFKSVWNAICLNISRFTSHLSNILVLSQRPTPRHFLVMRIPPQMERLLLFIMRNVPFSKHKFYMKWFTNRFIAPYSNSPIIRGIISPEQPPLSFFDMVKTSLATSKVEISQLTNDLNFHSQTFTISEMIRYIVCSFHPSNELLRSNVTPRWVVLAYLFSTIKNQWVMSNAKLSLFFDWLCYNLSVDSIMNIEPAILLMMNGLNYDHRFSESLIEFLTLQIEYFVPETLIKKYPSTLNVHKNCLNAFRHLLKHRVISTLNPLLLNTTFHQIVKQYIHKYFKSLLPNTNINTKQPPTLPTGKHSVFNSSTNLPRSSSKSLTSFSSSTKTLLENNHNDKSLQVPLSSTLSKEKPSSKPIFDDNVINSKFIRINNCVAQLKLFITSLRKSKFNNSNRKDTLLSITTIYSGELNKLKSHINQYINELCCLLNQLLKTRETNMIYIEKNKVDETEQIHQLIITTKSIRENIKKYVELIHQFYQYYMSEIYKYISIFKSCNDTETNNNVGKEEIHSNTVSKFRFKAKFMLRVFIDLTTISYNIFDHPLMNLIDKNDITYTKHDSLSFYHMIFDQLSFDNNNNSDTIKELKKDKDKSIYKMINTILLGSLCEEEMQRSNALSRLLFEIQSKNMKHLWTEISDYLQCDKEEETCMMIQFIQRWIKYVLGTSILLDQNRILKRTVNGDQINKERVYDQENIDEIRLSSFSLGLSSLSSVKYLIYMFKKEMKNTDLIYKLLKQVSSDIWTEIGCYTNSLSLDEISTGFVSDTKIFHQQKYYTDSFQYVFNALLKRNRYQTYYWRERRHNTKQVRDKDHTREDEYLTFDKSTLR